MHRAAIYIDPTGPTPVGFAQAAGMPGEIRLDFWTQANLPYSDIYFDAPQLVLRPFTQPYVHAYDIVVDDTTGASGFVTVPGVVMNDRFHVEVYARSRDRYHNPEVIGPPQRLLAYGRIDLNGWGYMRSGPLGPASFPTGPSGPAGLKGETGEQGPQGDPGMRGSRWYTGPGAPSAIPDIRVVGDMYLNESNGDVYRWDGVAWTAFKGV